MQDNKKSILSWALYDWGNSAFATTVMAGFFPLFFKNFWANPGNPNESTFYLGVGNSVASILVAMLAPFLGAVADKGSAKKKFLFLFAFLSLRFLFLLLFFLQVFFEALVLFLSFFVLLISSFLRSFFVFLLSSLVFLLFFSFLDLLFVFSFLIC